MVTCWNSSYHNTTKGIFCPALHIAPAEQHAESVWRMEQLEDERSENDAIFCNTWRNICITYICFLKQGTQIVLAYLHSRYGIATCRKVQRKDIRRKKKQLKQYQITRYFSFRSECNISNNGKNYIGLKTNRLARLFSTLCDKEIIHKTRIIYSVIFQSVIANDSTPWIKETTEGSK